MLSKVLLSIALFCNAASAMELSPPDDVSALNANGTRQLTSWESIQRCMLNTLKERKYIVGSRPYVFIDFNQTLAHSDHRAVLEKQAHTTGTYDVMNAVLSDVAKNKTEGCIPGEAVKCLDSLRRQQCRLLVLTMSGIGTHESRRRLIRDSGIGDDWLFRHEVDMRDLFYGAALKNGHIYCPPETCTSKQSAFFHFVIGLPPNMRPTSVFMIDDVQGNIDVVRCTCQSLAIHFCGIKMDYSKCEADKIMRLANYGDKKSLSIVQECSGFLRKFGCSPIKINAAPDAIAAVTEKGKVN